MDYIWRRLRETFKRSDETRLTFELDQEARLTLQRLAQEERRSDTDMAAGLSSDALERLQADDVNWASWESLTPRQKQVTALVCQGYTYRQIAARLKISPETVKTHMRNILYKFNLHRRAELQRVLAGWDFSAWK